LAKNIAILNFKKVIPKIKKSQLKQCYYIRVDFSNSVRCHHSVCFELGKKKEVRRLNKNKNRKFLYSNL